MSKVELCGIGKSMAGRSVLRDLDLCLESGQYVVLLGPSGCGKTTTLRVIAGLEQPETGTVRIDDREINGIPPSRRDVAMVFQSDALYPHLTVRQSMAYGLRGRVTKAEADERISDAARMVSIEPLLDRLPDKLSGGELRRAALAKAIARRASVRLLDEPLSAVDASAVHTIQADILRWHRCVEGTTLHVTHDGNEAMRMADMIAVMDHGRIVQFGPPDEIYRHPATMDVAAAVGWPPMSFLPARLSGGALLVTDHQHDPLKLGTVDVGDAEIILGVRPGDWRIASGQNQLSSPHRLAMKMKLTGVRRIDDRSMVSFQCASRQVSAMLPTSDGLELGKTYDVEVAVDDMHLFDASAGIRLAESLQA